MRSRQVVELLEAELSSTYVSPILPTEFVDYVLDYLEVIDKKSSEIRTVRARRTLKNSAVQPGIDFNIVAFRAYMISKMNKMLAEDAESLA